MLTPGETLGFAHEMTPSNNAAAVEGRIVATAVGRKSTELVDGIPRVAIEPFWKLTPAVGDVVYGRVIKILKTQATVAFALPNCSSLFTGIIRQQDVRSTLKDLVSVPASFRPGDIVRSFVISLGDTNNFYLSTARNDMGVVYAKSEAGFPMIPASWESMICTKTKAVESRKCAQPV